MDKAIHHIPVLLEETTKPFLESSGKIFIDGTLGGGGHLRYLLSRKPGAHFIGLDQDIEAIHRAKDAFAKEIEGKKLSLYHRKYSAISSLLQEMSLPGVDGIILDLGFSSFQMDAPDRGFSITKDGPLDMRLDQSQKITAEEIINEWSESDLIRLFFEFGEENFSKKIASRIIQNRGESRITRTRELAKIVESAIPQKIRKKLKIHPATKIFQALRIEVNQELDELKSILNLLPSVLNPGGIIAIISFHSLEDRLVKQRFKFLSDDCICPPIIMTCDRCHKPLGKLYTKKAIVPTEQEIANNPRSRSAKLRVFIRNK